MKTLIQNYGTGELKIAEVSHPSARPEGILVKTHASLVSAGTERQMVDLAQKSLVGKAIERPDLVGRVIEKIKKDGLLSTVEAVRSRLDNPVPLGYSSAGTVVEVGAGVEDFRVWDRVACAGAGYASQAEVLFVPKNLAVRLPGEVDFESAAFTTLGAIALHGLRLADVHLGETVAVIGLGLVGLITAQLAKASGCRVVGMDPNPERCRLAEKLGCDAAVTDNSQFAIRTSQLTGGYGADAVIITASTKSNDPVALAGEVTRDRATVVAVGLVGMDIPRKVYYEKELTFRVSRSYGPGRYDKNYEEKGRDYPIGYVRWTEQRNMEAFVHLLAEDKIDVKSLITHRFPIEEAAKAYDLITNKTKEPYLGILLTYPGNSRGQQSVVNCQSIGTNLGPPTENSNSSPSAPRSVPSEGRRTPNTERLTPVRVGLLGAGEFAKGTLLPAMKKVKGIEFVGVCAASGISANHAAKKFGFHYAATDENEIINNPDVNTVVIATRHHLHARQVIAALKAGKHVFVEKPLCINEQELNDIVKTYSEINGWNKELAGGEFSSLDCQPLTSNLQPSSDICVPPSSIVHRPSQILMVGYNRRFAPMARKMKYFLADVHEPLVMHYRINAGYIPPNHWVHDPEQGGGRIVGEVCHFVDFLTYLAGSLPKMVSAKILSNNNRYENDNLTATIEFGNGSIGAITYVANGDRSFPKERIEVFGGGTAAVLDNFRALEMLRNGRSQVIRSRFHQDKGHCGEWEHIIKTINGNNSLPIPFREMFSVTLTSFRLNNSLHSSSPIAMPVPSDTAESNIQE